MHGIPKLEVCRFLDNIVNLKFIIKPYLKHELGNYDVGKPLIGRILI